MVSSRPTGLRRGVEILFSLGEEEALRNGGLGVVRIAAVVGREKSQVSRTLKALAECGLVERDAETLLYRIGSRLFALAARAGHPRLLESAPRLLGRLVARVGETAHLSVLERAEVLTLLSESPRRAVRGAGWVGRTVPAYCTSSGRALLLDEDESELLSRFADVRFERRGPRTVASVGELVERVAAARAVGYAFVDEEFEAGDVGIAAPVRDFRGRIVAALNVSGPKFRLGERIEAAGLETKLAADELSLLVGWRGDDLSEVA